MSETPYQDIDETTMSMAKRPPTDKYGALGDEEEERSGLMKEGGAGDGLLKGAPTVSILDESPSPREEEEEEGINDGEDDDEDDDDEEDVDMSIEELIYSSTSYYAIAKPVTLTMILSALAVVFINDDATREAGQEAMSSTYLAFDVDGQNQGIGQNLAHSFGNAFLLVSFICCMTFVIVLLYRLKCMKCLIGYMIFCSMSLLGMLGGNLLRTAVSIYGMPVDIITFGLFVFNFCVVGVLAVFWGSGIPKYVTQGYLIATAVILSWHFSFFDEWTTWTLLFMLALYDLCAVLTPCGPLKFLVEAMSREDSPEMPGLLFEADLPPDAKRPGLPRTTTGASSNSSRHTSSSQKASRKDDQDKTELKIPLAIAKVYQLPVISVPQESIPILFPSQYAESNGTKSPLLLNNDSTVIMPEHPSAQQLQAQVVVRLPPHGGRLEQVQKRGRRVYLERDRHGDPKRILWVDRTGKVFAEMKEDDEDGPDRNSIRLGLGDFIFYSVLVAKAAQYSFATFAACMLVILAGLGGTLVLLSVYHHALPALPISICLGLFFYFITRWFLQPWVEDVLDKPFYV